MGLKNKDMGTLEKAIDLMSIAFFDLIYIYATIYPYFGKKVDRLT